MRKALTATWMASVIMAVGLLIWAGCADDNNGSTKPEEGIISVPPTDDPGPEMDGLIRMYMVDDPDPEFEHVYLDVTSVEVNFGPVGSEGSWITVGSNPGVYDLMALRNGLTGELCKAQLHPGHYSQIRLFLGDDNTVVVEGQSYPLEIPSAQQSGLKLNHSFDILPKTLYEVTLDFDAEDQIHQTGNGQWIMNPVIRVQDNAVSGSISGTVSPAAALPWVWTVAGADTISTLANNRSGYFKLMAVPIGTYTVHIDPRAGSWLDTTVTSVQVTALQNTDLGTIALQP